MDTNLSNKVQGYFNSISQKEIDNITNLPEVIKIL